MTKPTREEVDNWKYLADGYDEYPDHTQLDGLFLAYIAQDEELEVVELEKHTMCEAWGKQNKIIEQLKAENQALKASMEADYIERQAQHIQALVKENMELKAGSLRLEA